jgi:hypothetical protein
MGQPVHRVKCKGTATRPHRTVPERTQANLGKIRLRIVRRVAGRRSPRTNPALRAERTRWGSGGAGGGLHFGRPAVDRPPNEPRHVRRTNPMAIRASRADLPGTALLPGPSPNEPSSASGTNPLGPWGIRAGFKALAGARPRSPNEPKVWPSGRGRPAVGRSPRTNPGSPGPSQSSPLVPTVLRGNEGTRRRGPSIGPAQAPAGRCRPTGVPL